MITVITAWYNEEFLSNLFLYHYKFADKIIVLLDESTNDSTEDCIKDFAFRYQCPDIIVKQLDMPKGMDDKLKQRQINIEYMKITDGWVIIADADEYIYPPRGGLKHFLNSVSVDVVKVDYFQMFQHRNELALNRGTPVFDQRKHGQRNGLFRWMKPAVARAGKEFSWSVGHHEIDAMAKQYHPTMLQGAHWAMADLSLAIERRIKGRKNRMSDENKAANLSAHNFDVTADDLFFLCDINKNCPKVFE